MIVLTEPKIAGLAPRWAPFPGFSLLFDSPPEMFTKGNRIETLTVDVEQDPFYRLLHRALKALNPDLLLETYGFCPLPPPSYHVTAYDVANVADLPRCHAETRDPLRALLDRLPTREAFAGPLLEKAQTFARAAEGLTFRFGSLKGWNTLAVALESTDSAAYDLFLTARARLSEAYRTTYGVGAGKNFTPHVSLGYFLNDPGAELARARTAEWNATFRALLTDTELTFPTLSLYAFTDMATFFRQAP